MQGHKDAWGKWNPSGDFHRLEHHCADVAVCFEALLRDPVLRDRFDKACGKGGLHPITEARLAAFAYLQDFGKINTGFQFQVYKHEGIELYELPPKAGHIQQAFQAFHHSEVLEALGFEQLAEKWGENGFYSLLLAALAHHGKPPEIPDGQGRYGWWQCYGSYDPIRSAKLLVSRLEQWFPDAFNSGPLLPASPELAHLFAGIGALADQIASNEKNFPYESKEDHRYISRARARAKHAIQNMGFERKQRPNNCFQPTGSAELVGHTTLRPLQKSVDQAPLDIPLLILESETGSGKTEAAILRFARLWKAGVVDGLYFALPTRAAAKQIHQRVWNSIKRLCPGENWTETILAVPGYLKAGQATGEQQERFQVSWDDDDDLDDERKLSRWAAESPRKYLSSTSAVGTIDQVLLAGLRAKWAHFRGAALSRSLLVVDEVHASDTYMTEVLQIVLRNHLSVGGHALLMSATLGSMAKTLFIANGERNIPSLSEAVKVEYPALTLASGCGVWKTRGIKRTGEVKQIEVNFEEIIHSADKIARLAMTAANQGARVLVIRNTVRGAQKVFKRFLKLEQGEALSLQAGNGPALHHSRFAVEDRNLLDQAVESALGKNRTQEGRVIIGTQTLEQSLDIDADFLITDICPIDVLLQRLGRLHRHKNYNRPLSFTKIRCIVLVPPIELGDGLSGELAKYGLGPNRSNRGIYTNLVIIKRTIDLIRQYPIWDIPHMNRRLVEEGTHQSILEDKAKQWGSDWQKHLRKNLGCALEQARSAEFFALSWDKCKFDPLGEYRNWRFPLDEKVRTRIGDDSIRIKLPSPVLGPFGEYVQVFNIPAFLLGTKEFPQEDIVEVAQAEIGRDRGIMLSIGDQRFFYSRIGLCKL